MPASAELLQQHGLTADARERVVGQDGRLVARSTGAQGSSRLLSLRGANALLFVPGDGRTHPAGAELDALLTGPLGMGDGG